MTEMLNKHPGGFVMYAVVRIYTGPGAKQFFDILSVKPT